MEGEITLTAHGWVKRKNVDDAIVDLQRAVEDLAFRVDRVAAEAKRQAESEAAAVRSEQTERWTEQDESSRRDTRIGLLWAGSLALVGLILQTIAGTKPAA